MKLFFGLTLLILNVYNNAFSQTQLTLKLDKSFDTSKIKIFYADGEVNKFITPKFIENVTLINEDIKSKYARIIFMYPDNLGRQSGLCFLVNQNKSFIQFNAVADSVMNKISNYEIKNLIQVDTANVFKPLNKYTTRELNKFNKISAQIEVSPSDTLVKQQETAYDKLALKQIEFIKTHGSEYFLFEKFINEIVPALKASYLPELYEIFNSTFPSKFLESYEGKATKTLLEGKLFVKIGMQSPQFITKDILGNEISSQKLKGKYYLLSYWASWCSPCLKEIPQLKIIRDLYSEDKLTIISVTRDTDSSKFIQAVGKYHMNWTHVFHSLAMQNLYGYKPIPSVYLIDDTGKIIFSSWEKNLSELDDILKNNINNY